MTKIALIGPGSFAAMAAIAGSYILAVSPRHYIGCDEGPKEPEPEHLFLRQPRLATFTSEKPLTKRQRRRLRRAKP